MRSCAWIARTVVVFGYLLALALAGTADWGAVAAGTALIAVWAAPLALRLRAAHHRVGLDVPAAEPALGGVQAV
jgi:hypothetical protein